MKSNRFLKTLEIKHKHFGRIVINAADFNAKKHELFEEGKDAAKPPFTAEEIEKTAYAGLRDKAKLFGVTGNGKDALVDKLKEAGLIQ